MEPSALILLERAERAARERRLAAGLEAERRIAAARAEAARIEQGAAAAAAAAGETARHAVSAAADQEITALEAEAVATFHPPPGAPAAAGAFVVGALLGETSTRAAAPGEASRAVEEG